MNRNKVLGLLGLAEKAGKVRSGEMFRNMCTYYKVPYFEFGNKEELGHILGKQMRASLAVIDPNFSEALLKHFAD